MLIYNEDELTYTGEEPEYDPDDYEQAQNYCADSLDLISLDRY